MRGRKYPAIDLPGEVAYSPQGLDPTRLRHPLERAAAHPEHINAPSTFLSHRNQCSPAERDEKPVHTSSPSLAFPHLLTGPVFQGLSSPACRDLLTGLPPPKSQSL
jgi:hypothetical protein